MNQKLFRSRNDVMLAGVCGGLALFLGVDSSFVRLFFVLFALANNGLGLLVYLLLWIIIPPEDQRRLTTLGEIARVGAEEIAQHARVMSDDLRHAVTHPNPRARIYIGIALVILGGFYLIDNLHLPWLRWLDLTTLWPLLLIFFGLALLISRWRGE